MMMQRVPVNSLLGAMADSLRPCGRVTMQGRRRCDECKGGEAILFLLLRVVIGNNKCCCVSMDVSRTVKDRPGVCFIAV